MNLNDALITFLAEAKDAGYQKLVVAYSGGIDSHVLLSSLHELRPSIPLEAIYINHQLQSEANNWGLHCDKICLSLGIPFKQITVNATPLSGESPEEKARIVRYEALSKILMKDHCLLTAQHQDDQAETLLLQLLRGSGVEGLSAMPLCRSLGLGVQMRPFLAVSRQEIESYAKDHKLQWVEDPSNQELTIARNYLRLSIMPSFLNVWPKTNSMISRSAKWLGEASEILSEVAEQDVYFCRDEQQSLNITKLQTLSINRQKNLIRYWFHQHGLKRPGIDKLDIIFNQIVEAQADANPQLDLQKMSVRRYKDKLFIVPIWAKINNDWTCEWDAISTMVLSDDWATIEVKEAQGLGLSEKKTQLPLTLRIRQGGEKCQPVGRDCNRSLKKLFQEYSVAPWLRDRWPLLYSEETLVAVPGLFICEGYQATDAEIGVAFKLHIADNLVS